MTKHYDNESPYDNPEIIRRIGILGDMWTPGMSDEQVNGLYDVLMNPNPVDTPLGNLIIGYLKIGIILDKTRPDHHGNDI